MVQHIQAKISTATSAIKARPHRPCIACSTRDAASRPLEWACRLRWSSHREHSTSFCCLIGQLARSGRACKARKGEATWTAALSLTSLTLFSFFSLPQACTGICSLRSCRLCAHCALRRCWCWCCCPRARARAAAEGAWSGASASKPSATSASSSCAIARCTWLLQQTVARRKMTSAFGCISRSLRCSCHRRSEFEARSRRGCPFTLRRPSFFVGSSAGARLL